MHRSRLSGLQQQAADERRTHLYMMDALQFIRRSRMAIRHIQTFWRLLVCVGDLVGWIAVRHEHTVLRLVVDVGLTTQMRIVFASGR